MRGALAVVAGTILSMAFGISSVRAAMCGADILPGARPIIPGRDVPGFRSGLVEKYAANSTHGPLVLLGDGGWWRLHDLGIAGDCAAIIPDWRGPSFIVQEWSSRPAGLRR